MKLLLKKEKGKENEKEEEKKKKKNGIGIVISQYGNTAARHITVSTVQYTMSIYQVREMRQKLNNAAKALC